MALDKAGMFTLIGAQLPDNTSGAITPDNVRQVMTQLADSMLYAAAGVKEVEVLRAASLVAQNPTAVDTPLQLTFGAAQKGVSDPVMLSAAGAVTFNTAGNYAIRVKLQNARTTATGVSLLFSRLLLNGVQIGSPQCVRMDNATATFVTDSRVVLAVSAGAALTVQIMRDSSGANFGGVLPFGATVTSWGVAPSALIVVSRLEAV